MSEGTESSHVYTLSAKIEGLIRALDRLEGEYKAAEKGARSLDREQQKVEKASVKLGKALGVATVGANALAAGAVAAAGAFGGLASSVFDTIDTMNTLAQSSGLSTERIGALRLAARAANKDLASVVPTDFGKRLLEVASGTGRASKAFDTLGISTADAQALLGDADAAMDLIVDRLFEVEDPAARAGLAMTAMGEAGGELLSLLSSSDDLDRFVVNAEHFGINAGPAAVDASTAWWSAVSNLRLAFENVAKIIVSTVAPVATRLIENFTLGFVFVTEIAEQFWSVLSSGVPTIEDVEGAFANAVLETKLFWDTNQRGADAAIPEFERARRKVDRFTVAARAAAKASEGATSTIGEGWLDLVEAVADAEDRAAAFEARVSEVGRTVADSFGQGLSALRDMLDEIRAYGEEQFELLHTSITGFVTNVGTVITAVATAAADALTSELEPLEKKLDRQKGKVGELRDKIDAARAEDRGWAVEQLQMDLAEVQSKKDKTKASIDAIDEQIAKQQQAARIGFRLEQTAALGEIAINSAVAFTALLAAMAYLGPGAPVAAAGIVGASAAAQVATVMAQQPPSFHDGGVLAPDEFAFGGGVARAGERAAVLNQRAVETGGEAVVDSLNRGLASGPVRLVLEDAGRVIGEAVLVAANGPGQTGRDLRRALGGDVPVR